MLVSYEKKFLFVHVPKTAGTSICRALSPFAESPETLPENRLLAALGIHVNHIGPWHRKRFRGHSTLKIIKRNLPQQVYDDLFRFAFVRNPWDLLVSLYHFISSRPKHRYAKLVADMSFAEFIDVWTKRSEISQRSFLVDDKGNLDVDFVGRFEHLNADFSAICAKVGVKLTLPHANSSRRGDYRVYYTDELAELVGKRLSDDIAAFDYHFDRLAA